MHLPAYRSTIGFLKGSLEGGGLGPYWLSRTQSTDSIGSESIGSTEGLANIPLVDHKMMIMEEEPVAESSHHRHASPSRSGSTSETSDTASLRASTPLPETSGMSTTYATHGKLVSSSDTLRLIPSPDSMETSREGRPTGLARAKDGQEGEGGQPSIADGVALLASKGTGQDINTKRMLIASLNSPGHEWDILQGKRDDEVESQVGALGLQGMHMSKDSIVASDISRTPSQSTTGTAESSTTGSLETAASSLQSGSASDSAMNDLTHQSHPPSQSPGNSPNLYITACSSSDDLLQEKRISTALRRYHALLELVETEKGYADDLSTLVTVFFHNLTSQAFFDESEPRLAAVCRNAGELLDLHSDVARKLSIVVEDANLSSDAEGSDMDKALRCEEAVIRIAHQLTQMAPQFHLYQLFCARHAEALVLIREAEKRHNGDDFAAFERMCGNLLRGQARHQGRVTPSSRRSSAGTSTPLAVSSFSIGSPDEPAPVPSSGTTTPSGGSFASLSRQTSGRLLFADYLIKPIQRLCLYPLVLNSLLKYTPEEETRTRLALEGTIEAMRKIADRVDLASKQRERDLMAELIVSKVEPLQGITHSLLKSFGNPLLSGALDVLHHHDFFNPLSPPLRFQRLGLVLWSGFLLIVRVRKNQQLDCKYWLPLSNARLASIADSDSPGTETASWTTAVAQPSKPVIPHPLRLSSQGHHFELSASTDRERQLWHSRLSQSIDEAPSVLQSFPCNLPDDMNMHRLSASESLFNFFANNVKSSMNNPDFLVKFPSASTRAGVDRNMIFSDLLLSSAGGGGGSGGMTASSYNAGGGYGPVAVSAKEVSEALVTQQLRQNATPSIGSAVGAAMGLARMAATQMPTAVKRNRRQSMLNLTEINPTCDALLIDSPTEPAPLSGLASPLHRNSTTSLRTSAAIVEAGEASGSGSKWKSTLLRRNSKAASAKSVSGSVPPSPMTSTTDLSQTIVCSSPLGIEEEGGGLHSSLAKPAHLRSKSLSLRDVWQNSIGRRSRSHSSSSEKGLPVEYATLSPSSNRTSLTSSPVMQSEDARRERGSTRPDGRTGSDVESLASPIDTSEGGESAVGSADSTGFSSVAQLRRILNSTTTGQPASTSSRRTRYLTPNRFSTSSRPTLSRSSSKGGGGVLRSTTELALPLVSSLQIDDHERRKSEPEVTGRLDAPSNETDRSPSAFTLHARHSLRRLRTRSSQMVSSGGGGGGSTNTSSSSPSPVPSIINFTSSWGDHSRLNSVEENMAAEVIESSGGGGVNKEEAKPGRPRLSRRPSTAEK